MFSPILWFTHFFFFSKPIVVHTLNHDFNQNILIVLNNDENQMI